MYKAHAYVILALGDPCVLSFAQMTVQAKVYAPWGFVFARKDLKAQTVPNAQTHVKTLFAK